MMMENGHMNGGVASGDGSLLALDEDSGILISNLVSSDEAVVPTIRSVLERGSGDRFGGALDQFVQSKENELRNLCNFHFTEFSEGIEDIGRLKVNSSKLRKRLQEMDQEMQTKGTAVIKTSEQLLRFYRVQRNLKHTKKELGYLLNLVGLVKRARALVDQKSFFEALQCVDLIREVIHGKHMNDLFQKREGRQVDDESNQASGASRGKIELQESVVIAKLESFVPRIVEEITVKVNQGLTEWFVMARDRAGSVGAKALQMVTDHQLKAIAGVVNSNLMKKPEDEPTQQLENGNGEKKKKVVTRHTLTKMRHRSSSDLLLEWEHREPTSTVGIAETCLRNEIDFGPVYKYLDIQAYLGAYESAIDFYKKNRIPQASLQSMIPIDINKLQPGQFQKYYRTLFEKITGFFLVEGSLTRSLNLIPQYELSALWDSMLNQLAPAIRGEFRNDDEQNKNPMATLDLVQILINLSILFGKKNDQDEQQNDTQQEQMMKIASNKMLDTSRLVDICMGERNHIANVLFGFAWNKLLNIVNKEKCIPLRLEGKDDAHYATILGFGFIGLEMDGEQSQQQHDGKEESSSSSSSSSDKNGFPLSFTFSETVPLVCETIIDLLERAFSLIRQLGGVLPSKRTAALDVKDMSPFVSSAATASLLANQCLEKLNATLSEVIMGDNASAEILCQYAVNSWFLHRAGYRLEQYAKSLANIGISGDNQHKTSTKISVRSSSSSSSASSSAAALRWWSLPACDTFKETSEVAESRVMDSIHGKIDELLSSRYSVDWLPSEASNDPHWFITDTIQYLSVTFGPESCLRLLPVAKFQAIHFTSCGRISEAIFDLLVGDRVSGVNALSVYTLSKDIQVLIEFAAKSSIPGLEESFTQLDQMISLFVNGDLDGFLKMQTRMKKYGYLNANDVLTVCKKYRQIDGSNRMFSNARFAIIKDSELKRVMEQLA